jgi:hypothetical protein
MYTRVARFATRLVDRLVACFATCVSPLCRTGSPRGTRAILPTPNGVCIIDARRMLTGAVFAHQYELTTRPGQRVAPMMQLLGDMIHASPASGYVRVKMHRMSPLAEWSMLLDSDLHDRVTRDERELTRALETLARCGTRAPTRPPTRVLTVVIVD